MIDSTAPKSKNIWRSHKRYHQNQIHVRQQRRQNGRRPSVTLLTLHRPRVLLDPALGENFAGGSMRTGSMPVPRLTPSLPLQFSQGVMGTSAAIRAHDLGSISTTNAIFYSVTLGQQWSLPLYFVPRLFFSKCKTRNLISINVFN